MNQWTIILWVIIYLGFLFGIAWWSERRSLKDRKSFISNPFVYALSLTVFCSAWTYYGSVGKAASEGLTFLPIYLGPTLMAPLWWLVMRKIIRISKVQSITTISDFISSRYAKSVSLGWLVALLCVFAIIPYIALQLKAIVNSVELVQTGNVLSDAVDKTAIPYSDHAAVLTVILGIFTIVYGVRKIDTSEQHQGMVAAIAFESVLKLMAFMLVGFVVTFVLFKGPQDLFDQAYATGMEQIFTIDKQQGYAEWFWVLLISGLAIFFLPRQFHMSVVENVDETHLKQASWVFPLYMLLINLFVLPIAVAGNLIFGPAPIDADWYVLAIPIAYGYDVLAFIIFLGGFAAATSMIIVSTIALSIMLSNNVLLPLLLWVKPFKVTLGKAISSFMIYSRWISIALVLYLAYYYFVSVAGHYSLVSIGLISFAAVAQLAPVTLGGIYWKKGNKYGALAAIVTGFIIWAWTIVVPSLVGSQWLPQSLLTEAPMGITWLSPVSFLGVEGLGTFSNSIFLSLFFNTMMYIGVSTFTQQSAVGHQQAELFVDIFQHSTVIENTVVWKGTAYLPDINTLLSSFFGKEKASELLDDFYQKHSLAVQKDKRADPRVVTYAEKLLAGVIGTASARIMVSNIVKEEEITLSEVMSILRESQQLMKFNKVLTRKSEELRQATLELKMANEKLRQIDELKDEFLNTVTHELRTPVTSIRAFAEILYDNPDLDEAERLEFLQTIIFESERMTRLITDVLDLEKLESGAQKLNISLFTIGGLLEEAVKSVKQLANEKKIPIFTNIQPDIPLVEADRDRILQVLLNLLSNAIKFCPEEQGEIYLAAAAEDSRLRCSVADNGVGVPETYHELIFDKFYQLKRKSSDHKPKGTGLGLAISKKIVELHQGQIWVENIHPSGACFLVSIPLVQTKPTETAAAQKGNLLNQP